MLTNENEENEVSIVGTLTYEDYKKFNNYHQRKIHVSYFLIALIVSTFILVNSMSGIWTLVFLISLTFSAIISGAFTLLLIFTMRIRIRREYKSDRLLKTEILYVVNNQGINQKFRKSNTYFEWNDIIKAYENKDLFRLYVSKNKAIILPKRFFKTNEDVDLFINIVKESLDTNRVKIM